MLKFINIPIDILNNIISFLDNKTNVILMLTCKYLSNHGKKFGYLNSIKLDYKDNYNNFIHKYSNHHRTIKKIEIIGYQNPHLWIPKYVEIIIFSHCSINHYLNPGLYGLATKVLILKDYNRYRNHYKLHVNWEFFKNLEILELYVYDVDIKDITKLTKLHSKKINTVVKKYN